MGLRSHELSHLQVLEKSAPPQPPAGQAPKDPSLAGKVGTLKLLSSKATWAIIVVNFVNHWGYFIYLNWMPSYFVRVLGVDLRASSFLSFLPWTVMAVGSTSAGPPCCHNCSWQVSSPHWYQRKDFLWSLWKNKKTNWRLKHRNEGLLTVGLHKW